MWVDTFGRVAEYEKEQAATKLAVRKRRGGYEVAPSLALDKKLYDEPLTLVVKNPEGKITASQDSVSLKAKRTGDAYVFDFNPHGGKINIAER